MIAFACALLLATGCADLPVGATPVGYVVRAQGLNAQAALAEINAFRRRHGLKPVVLDQRLIQAAGTSARYQASRGRIGHRGPGGSRPWDRARRAGYSTHLTAENVASGQKSFGEAMRGWEHSAEHKRNLLLPDAQAAGIAVSYRIGPRLLHARPRRGVGLNFIHLMLLSCPRRRASSNHRPPKKDRGGDYWIARSSRAMTS
jgi:hypothetical protein